MVQFALQRRAHIDVRDFGATGGGVTDDTDAIQDTIDAADEGSTIFFPAGRYLVSAQIAWTNKLHLVFADGAIIVEDSAISGAILLCTGGDGSTVDNLTIEGIEDSSSFDGLDSSRYGVCFSGVADGRIRHPTITGKSKAIGLIGDCVDCRVIEPTITGFLATHASGSNYHNGVWVIGGSGNRIIGIIARNIGSAVTGGGDTVGLEIEGGCCDTFHDNAAYISSGIDCKVTGFRGTNSGQNTSAVVKARGSGHRITNISGKSIGQGIVVSGNGTTADAYGNNGHGIVVSEFTFEDVILNGILLDNQDGFWARDVIVTKGTLINTVTNADGNAAVRGWADDSDISDILIKGCDGTVAAVLVAWVAPGGSGAATVGRGTKVRNITIRDAAGDGLRLQDCEDCEVSGIKGFDVGSDLVDARDVLRTTFRNLDADTDINCLRLDADCENCRIENTNGNMATAGTRAHVILGTGHLVSVRDRSSPEGAVVAAPGSVWYRTDGGSGTTVYLKETGTGNTGWVAA